MDKLEEDVFRKMQFTVKELNMHLRAYLDGQTKIKKRFIDRNIEQLIEIIEEYRLLDYRSCLVCGKLFIPETSNKLYCSDECRDIAQTENINKYKKKVHVDHYPCSGISKIRDIPENTCLNCNANKCRLEL